MHDTVDTVDDRVGASCLKVLVTQVLSTETGLFKLKNKHFLLNVK
jgi:hypothetical protein